MVAVFFIVLLIASCAYAFLAGGKEGRCVCFLLIAATILSLAAGALDITWSRTQLPVLLVDLLLLGGLARVALRSRRYWPLWITAFHLVSIGTHVATAMQPNLQPLIYFAMQSFWSLPGLLAMVCGIMLDRRAGLPLSSEPRAEQNDEPRHSPPAPVPDRGD